MKFEKKLDSIMWWIIRLYPFIFVLLFVIGINGSIGININDYVVAFNEFNSAVITDSTIGFIVLPIYTIFYNMFGELGNIPQAIICYISYVIFVELVRFICFFFTFIFKLMRNWCERFV